MFILIFLWEEIGRRDSIGNDRKSHPQKKWKGCHDRRTAVERINRRLDTSFGFEKHTIHGLTKMSTHCWLALVVMLAMAVGRINANQAGRFEAC